MLLPRLNPWEMSMDGPFGLSAAVLPPAPPFPEMIMFQAFIRDFARSPVGRSAGAHEGVRADDPAAFIERV